MRNNISKATVVFLAVGYIIINILFRPTNIICWDVFGYYLYLPTFLINQDPGLDNIEIIEQVISSYKSTGSFYQVMRLPDGGHVFKYSMGMAILYLPFFLIGHLMSWLLDYPMDGFSIPYQYSLFAGSIIYTITGMIIIRKVLLRYFNDALVAILLAIIYLGTNYFFHTAFHGQNAMSHNYLFTLYAAIIYFSIKWNNKEGSNNLVILGLLCGLTILARPSEIVCLIIPFAWGIHNGSTFKEKIRFIFSEKKALLLFSGIMIALGSLQFLYWYYNTGEFLFNSYGGNPGEGFEFGHPFITEVLFSYRKGWLLYTPVFILSISGLILLWKDRINSAFAITIYFIINLYIVSSWSCWWYAESFGQRALVPSLAVMIIPLGYFIQFIQSRTRYGKVVMLFVAACIVLNLFQTWQFMNQIIDGSRMTKEYYWKVFGKTAVPDGAKDLLLIDRSLPEDRIINDLEYSVKVYKAIDFESEPVGPNITDSVSHTGKKSFFVGPDIEYPPGAGFKYMDIIGKDHAWIRVSVWVYPTVDFREDPSAVLIKYEHEGYEYKTSFKDFHTLNLPLGQWSKVTLQSLTPEVRSQEDDIKVFLWHHGKKGFYYDDLVIEILEKK